MNESMNEVNWKGRLRLFEIEKPFRGKRYNKISLHNIYNSFVMLGSFKISRYNINVTHVTIQDIQGINIQRHYKLLMVTIKLYVKYIVFCEF